MWSDWGGKTVPALQASERTGLQTATQPWLPKGKSSVIGVLPSALMPAGNRAQPRFLRISEVLDRVGVSRPTIYRWMREGTFPKQISIGANSVVWLESDVTKWMDQRIGAR